MEKKHNKYNKEDIPADLRDRHFMARIISAVFMILGIIMTPVCYLQGNMTLVYISIGYGTLFACILVQLYFSKNLNFFFYTSFIILYALEVLYIFTGGQEGFGLIWIIVLPLFSVYMTQEVKYLIFINLFPFVVLVTFFWTPLFKYCYAFDPSFRIRFPILFLIEFLFSVAIKSRMQRSESERNENLRNLNSLKDSLEQKVQQRTNELREEKEKSERFTFELAMSLTATIDAKDKYTSGHSTRVANYSKQIAALLGKSEVEQEKIQLVGLLHDIGKIGVPDEIINKTERLTDEEYSILKNHPVIGYDILKNMKSMPEILIGVRWHHERYDGKGYPDCLKGEEIHEYARIISVADAYDAMTSNRSYRKLLPQNIVRDEIIKGKGTQFDPKIADKMLELINQDTEYKMHG